MSRISRVASLAGVTVSAVIGLAACAPPSGGGNSSDSATILLPQGFTSLDPALASEAYSRVVQAFLYDKLIGLDGTTGGAVSNVASSWNITPTKAHFVIKDGITCSDGAPFTAATVVRNLERMKDPKTAAPLTAQFLGSYDYTVALGADKKSVDIDFPSPVAFLQQKLADGPGLVCDSGLDDPSKLNTKSAGTGPYVLTKATTGDTYVMSRRDGYTWGINGASTSNAIPKTVTIRFVANEDTMANLMSSGQGDIALLGGAAGKRAKAVGDPSVLAWTLPTTALFFNHRPGYITADTAVRRALSQLLSPKSFAAVTDPVGGTGATSITGANAVCSAAGKLADSLPTGGVTAAATTLTADGWSKGPDGVWQKGGKRLSVHVINDDIAAAGMEYIRSTWAGAGIDVSIDPRSGSAATNALFDNSRWDVSLIGFGASLPRPSLFSGTLPPRGTNFSAITNAGYNKAVEEGAVAPGSDCAPWIEGEKALMRSADVLPLMIGTTEFISPDYKLGKLSGIYLVPTSLTKR
ncbi:MAG: ABC transporter substrate-binding protein [Gordonia sp. (in: high G+C Gram-positive bacteria)]